MIKLNKIKIFIFIAIIFSFIISATFSFAQITIPPGFGNPTTPTNPFSTTPPTFVNSTAISTSSPTSGSSCNPTIDDIGDLLCKFSELLNAIVPVLLALGVVYFVWGVVQYVIGDDEEAKKKGKNRIIFGIIGLAVIVSLWGLVTIVVNTFGLDNNYTFSNPGDVILQKQASEGGLCSLKQNPKFQNLLDYATCIISKSVIPLIFILALAMFVWGVAQFVILGAGEEAKREQGKQLMIWGIIALAVMVSVWGLVKILGNTFNIDYTIPTLKQ